MSELVISLLVILPTLFFIVVVAKTQMQDIKDNILEYKKSFQRVYGKNLPLNSVIYAEF